MSSLMHKGTKLKGFLKRAIEVFYDNTDSGLTADTVQDAIDEMNDVNNASLKLSSTITNTFTPTAGTADGTNYYYKVGTKVHVRIKVSSITGDQTIFTLPAGFRPNTEFNIAGYAGKVKITTAGVINVNGTTYADLEFDAFN